MVAELVPWRTSPWLGTREQIGGCVKEDALYLTRARTREVEGDLTRPAFVPFGQPSVPLRTPVVSPGAASSSVLPQLHVAAFPNGGNELPQSSAAAFPNVQLSAQVQGLEQMMQQMVLRQQTFMQTRPFMVQDATGAWQ